MFYLNRMHTMFLIIGERGGGRRGREKGREREGRRDKGGGERETEVWGRKEKESTFQ